ncbi:hypothetical protein T440DRAFT_459074 [Plenodomus tracheiphilus IPT5]|uniref:Fucose-specific lectin n=1 Tax=Plenodomus tracheiphilus IPT5 TaxID=1408161 RepID=A0A6A7ASF0_9PLEO|nr:hypothetical protein T440DRAFT_459074 [Plenodomus tracheiphilus IPT5]
MLSSFILLVSILHISAAQTGTLLILDTGVGHRSAPIPHWRTSLRRLEPSGTNASIIQSFGPDSTPDSPAEPISAHSIVYTNITDSAYLATGQGIIRAAVDTGDNELIISTHDADGDMGWLYWSASRGANEGSIRRAPLTGMGVEEVLVAGLNMPGQLRLVRDTITRTNSLWWTEKGRWGSSSTSLKLIDLFRFAEYPSLKPLPPPTVSPVQTMIHSDNSSVFFEKDAAGEKQTLGIQSFVVYRDGVTQRVWFVAMSDGRTVFGKLVEMTWQGSGDGRKAVLKVFNQDTGDLGAPVGLEYAP